MARLPQGTRKRSDGMLEKRFSVNGQRYSVYGRNSKEITAREQELREAIKQGTYTRNADVTLNEYFEEFQKQREGTVKRSTMAAIRSVYDSSFRDTIGNEKIRKLEKRQIVKLQQRMTERLKVTTVNMHITKLKTILNYAVVDGIIVKSPAIGVKPLKIDECVRAVDTIHRALSLQEQTDFLMESKSEWLYPFFLFSLSTGMRLMEVGALTWADVDQISNVIHCTKTLSRVGGSFEVTPPKSKTSVRDIPINEPIKEALRLQRENLLMMFGTKALKMDSRIFIGIRGGVIESTTVKTYIQKVLKRLDAKGTHIERFTHHAFRDSFATRAIENGMGMKTLQTILGHNSLGMTMDLYCHVLPNKKQEEMTMIEDSFLMTAGK